MYQSKMYQHRKPSSGDLVEVENDYFCYSWTINDFCVCSACDNRGSREDIISQDFRTGSNRENLWCLILNPRLGPQLPSIFISNSTKTSSLFLYLKDCVDPEIEVYIRMFVFDSFNNKRKNVKEMQIKCKKGERYGFSDFLDYKTIREAPSCEITPNGKLIIVCEIQSVNPRVKFFEKPKQLVNKSTQNTLPKNLKTLFVEQKFSDVTIVVGENEFYVHKLILVSRSSVFDAMFQHDMQEKEQNIIHISDIKPEVIKEMLHFMYTDEVDNLEDSASDLLAAADKYALEELKIMCEYALMKNITKDIAFGLLIMADLYKANHLKKEVLDIIATNIREMIEYPEFKDITKKYHHLVQEILVASAQKD